MNHKLFKFAFILFCCAGCASLRNGSRQLSIQSAESIRPGHARKVDVISLLGMPHRTRNLREHPEINRRGEVWAYFDPSDKYRVAGKIDVFFDENSDIVRSVAWEVGEHDAEREVKTVKDMFSGIELTSRDPEWTNPHAGPDYSLLENKAKGIAVSINTSSGKVTTIHWVDPKFDSDSIIIDRKKPNPLFCIGAACARMPKKRNTASSTPESQ